MDIVLGGTRKKHSSKSTLSFLLQFRTKPEPPKLKETAEENGEEGNEIDSPARAFEVERKSKGNGHKKRGDSEESTQSLEHSNSDDKLGIDEFANEETNKTEYNCQREPEERCVESDVNLNWQQRYTNGQRKAKSDHSISPVHFAVLMLSHQSRCQ